MEVKVHSIHFDADQKLIDLIEKKLSKLDQFHDGIVGTEVFLKLEKDTEKRENKVVEIKVFIPGKDLFAKKQSKSFEEAADDAVEALRKQAIKRKPNRRIA